MKTTALLLCDAATVREGLLNVLGAGITRLWHAGLPVALNVTVAALVAVEQHELERPHEFHFVIKDPERKVIMEAMGGFGVGRNPKLEKLEPTLFPIVVPVPPRVATNRWGKHLVEMTIDNRVRGTIEFYVLDTQEQQLPSLD